MLGLIVAIETAVGRNWLDFSDPVSLSWRFSAEAARVAAPGRDLLCLGDSLVKHGLIPSVMERESGLRAANLAAARCPTWMTYFLFRRALEAGAHPSAIIINAKPAGLIPGPDFNTRSWQDVLSVRDSLELAGMGGRGDFWAATLLGRLLPSLRSRLEVRSNLLAALRGQTDRLHDINRILWRNWTINDGANVASRDSRYGGELTADVLRNLRPDLFHVHRANAEGIERLIRLAAARNIRVFWLLPPLCAALQARRDESGAEAKYEEFLRAFQRRYPEVLTVLDARRAAYPPAMFVDATHLGGRGAIALSRAVAGAVRAELARPALAPGHGWIELSDRTEDHSAGQELRVEDLDQSKAIVHGDHDRGR
ncbi:MAG TPA: hypothetical protein VFF52_05655 [Isosphaeraceae bacterium]|nr:hypothetical protein [Isosphaeraceae bacterium]